MQRLYVYFVKKKMCFILRWGFVCVWISKLFEFYITDFSSQPLRMIFHNTTVLE